MMNIKRICLNVAVALILPHSHCLSTGRLTCRNLSHMESHIGNLTGHFRSRPATLLPLLLGLPRGPRRW